jgi:hypothetical protein
MGAYANFYNSVDNDRLYDASSMEEWLRPFFVTGVFNGNLQVTADGQSMTVTVASGYVNIKGKTRWFETPNVLSISAASGSLSRIDAIVVRRDDAARNITLEVVQGTAAESPTAPAPTRTDSVYELVLAYVSVGVGAINISQANITDKRPDPNVCGWVVATVTEMDFSQFTAQFEQYFAEFKAGTLADVTQWFADRENEFETWQSGQETALAAWQENREDNYEAWYSMQQTSFLNWVREMQEAMGEDPSSAIIALTQELDERLGLLEHMVIQNDITCPITDDDGALLVFDDDSALLAEISYEVA